MEAKYYDGTRLLSTKDLYGNTPEIFMCTTNRSGGKTTYFSRLCVKNFFKKGEKFALIYRYNYELDDCADKFYKDISSLFFPGTAMESKRKASGIYHELFINGKPCGYAISLNSADQLKKYSHLLSDVSRMFFDEFQSEQNHYCNNEIAKFISVHQSIARGQGKQSRYVPVYMCSNPVTLLNPYYISLGVAERLKSDTNFLRGEGYVLEQGFVDTAAQAQMESLFNRAFKKETYINYSAQATYLNDSVAFIERPSGNSKYMATLKYKGCEYGIREFPELGILYCDDRPDKTYPYKLCVTTDDHDINYVMLKRNDAFLSSMRYFFDKGVFRFKDLRCKEVILKSLSY